jgi:hypothetical protein
MPRPLCAGRSVLLLAALAAAAPALAQSGTTLSGRVHDAQSDAPILYLSVSGLFNREKILDDGDKPYFQGDLTNRVRLWQFLEDEVKYTAFGSAVYTRRFSQP